MPNWAWGTFRVTGRQEAVEAFAERLLTEDTVPAVPGVRHFARTFSGRTRSALREEIRAVFAGLPPGAEAVCCLDADFAWSAEQCLLDGYPQRAPEECISLPEACRADGVDAELWTKEPLGSFEEHIRCTRRGYVRASWQELQEVWCRRCGAVAARASFEALDDLFCGECGASDFDEEPPREEEP